MRNDAVVRRFSTGMSRVMVGAIAGIVAFSAIAGSACTIPVFRYALERWNSDNFLVIVYHRGPLQEAQEAIVGQWKEQSAIEGGPLNIEVVPYDLSSETPVKMLEVDPPPADRPLPWIEVRSFTEGRPSKVRWEGTLEAANSRPGLFVSPAREELVRRILDGHASVWLLIAPADQCQPRAEQLQALLEQTLETVSLPAGIGLPGSELYASVPLELNFSVLPIAHGDPNERTLLSLIQHESAPLRDDTAYLVPVFGRGRALDAIPCDDLEPGLVEDVVAFLCGACSCQVKQANPGFDLLLSVPWEERLFGEPPGEGRSNGTPMPPADRASIVERANGEGSPPEYVPIPGGSAPSAVEPHLPPNENLGDIVSHSPANSADSERANPSPMEASKHHAKFPAPHQGLLKAGPQTDTPDVEVAISARWAPLVLVTLLLGAVVVLIRMVLR